MWGLRCQWNSAQMNNRHPQHPAHLPQKWAKWAELVVQFSWQLQNGTQDFNFFNCHGCQTFILAEIHCYLSPHIFWTYYFIPKWCISRICFAISDLHLDLGSVNPRPTKNAKRICRSINCCVFQLNSLFLKRSRRTSLVSFKAYNLSDFRTFYVGETHKPRLIMPF